MTAYVICKIENLSPKFLPLPSRPARNPFPTLTKLPQLPVWLQRRIHGRILRLDSAKASNDFILITVFVFAVPLLNQLHCDVRWYEALSRCSWSERAHWSRMSVGTEQTFTPSLCGQYCNIVSGRSMNNRNYNIRKSISDGSPQCLLSYCADF